MISRDVVMQLNNRQMSLCHCSPRPKNDLIKNNAVCDTSALSVDQSCSMGSFKGKVVSDEFPPSGATWNTTRSNISQDTVGATDAVNRESSTNYSVALKLNPPVAVDPGKPNDGYTVVTNNRKKKRQPVIGKCSGSDMHFQGVAKKYAFCLNRLHPDTNVDTVTSFLKTHGVSVFSRYIVNNGSDENLSPKFISMKICISQLDTKKIYDPDLWPAGVTVRPWFFKQRSS